MKKNRWGCCPRGDVCVAHDQPRACRHGCMQAADHQCAERRDSWWDCPNCHKSARLCPGHKQDGAA